MMIEKNSNFIDNETGLPDKFLLNERFKMNIAFCKRYHISFAVCFMRLTYPAELNGDDNIEIRNEIRRMVANRLMPQIREIDTIGYIGSNDFIILLTDVSESESQIIIERLMENINGNYTYKHRKFNVSVNIGICMFPVAAETQETLMTIAKTEMFYAKKLGINYSFYNGQLDNLAYRKALIENDLNYALNENQFKVVYQPQYDLNNQQTFGVETLLRWDHPKIGPIMPGEFIELAQVSGKLNEIFFWMLEEICKLAKEINDRLIKFSINISIDQLLITDFVSKVNDILINNKLKQSQFIFEITESKKLYDMENITYTLKSLKESGFLIAIDDFGNGYFSFSNFIDLPLDFIKFDKDFVKRLIKDNKLHSVISPIIDMAHNLNLKVIVEGVETKNQLVHWKDMRCDIIQGYIISKPIERSELESLIHVINKSKLSNL